MQKSLFLLLILLTLVSCTKSGKKSKDGVTVTSPIHEDKSKLPAIPDLPTQYDDLKPTKTIHPERFGCLLDPANESQKIAVPDRKSSGKNSFHIYFNQGFIAKVVDDILAKANGQKISPDLFWTNINSQLGDTLNEYLLRRYIKYSKSAFDQIRKRIAYGITYFAEKQDYNTGLALKFADGKSLKLAFSSNPREMEYITICNEQDLNDYMIIPSRYTDTGHITGALTCTKGKEAVFLTIVKNERVNIELKSKKKRFTVYLPKADVDVDDDSTEVEVNTKGLDIEVEMYNHVKSVKKGRRLGRIQMRDTYTYYPNYYQGIDLMIESGEFEFEMDKMKCKTLKPFRL